MYFSTEPIVTELNPFSMTQLPSQSRSCGQTRPQISGKVLVVHLAEGHAALAATAGLGLRALRVEAGVDLLEILAPGAGGALVGGLLLEANELQHALGHGGIPQS